MRARDSGSNYVSLRMVLTLIFAGLAAGSNSYAQQQKNTLPELNTILMQSTYFISGNSKDEPGKTSFGTAFLMGKPIPGQDRAYYVLITAAHVLNNIKGDTANLRVRFSDGKSFRAEDWPIKIRNGEKNLYVTHKNADVSALYVNMPDKLDVTILPTGLLADDSVLAEYEIHPGDELLCLGYPLGVSSKFWFPILRSGKIASYPILPTDLNSTFYFDFNVFEGNSGGPVYFVGHDRTYGGSTHLAQTIQFVVGLVTAQLSSKAYNNQQVELAEVIPSPFIIQTIGLLPETSPYK
jgi:hypothetical protein